MGQISKYSSLKHAKHESKYQAQPWPMEYSCMCRTVLQAVWLTVYVSDCHECSWINAAIPGSATQPAGDTTNTLAKVAYLRFPGIYLLGLTICWNIETHLLWTAWQFVETQKHICCEGHILIMRFHQPQKLESHLSVFVSKKQNLACSVLFFYE